MKKRILSMLLCVCLLAGLLPAQALANESMVSRTVSVGADPTQVGVPILNAQSSQDSVLIGRYAKNGTLSWPNALTLSAGPAYLLNKKDNNNGTYTIYDLGFNPKEYGLFYGADFKRNKKADWNMKFTAKSELWEQNSLFQRLASAGELAVNFGADFAGYGGSQPKMEMAGKHLGGAELEDNAVNRKESGWVHLGSIPDKIVLSGNGGGSGATVSLPWVLFADTTYPTVKSASMRGRELIVTMSEPLRLANTATTTETLKHLSLELTAMNRSSGVANLKMTAQCIGFESGSDDKLVFRLDDTEEHKDFQIVSIDNFLCTPGGAGYDEEEKYYPVDIYGMGMAYEYRIGQWDFATPHNQMGKLEGQSTTSTTPITDLAGNELKIGKTNLVNCNLIVDEVGPQIASVEVSGSMISTDSTTGKDHWPADIDRSSVFAGVGDTLTFSVQLDETIDTNSAADTKLQLNINNGGQPVTLALAQAENKMVGVNGRDVAVLTFAPLTITPEMAASVAETPIAPTALVHTSIMDEKGNQLANASISVTPRQQIYLDNVAVTATAMAETSGAERTYCIPLTFSDGTGLVSDFIGLTADFAWVGNSGEQIPFTYAVTEDAQPPAVYTNTSTLNAAESPAWNQITLPAAERFLHIEISSEVAELELKDTQLMLRTNDWAGNVGTQTLSLGITLDEVAPVLSLISMNTEYTAEAATVTAKVKVEDLSGVTAKYQWVEKNAAASESWENGAVTDGVLTIEDILTGETQLMRDLLVQATDEKGNPSELARYSVCVDLTKAKAKYRVDSDLSLPQADPQVMVSGPEAQTDGTASTRVTLTMGEKMYAHVLAAGTEEENLFAFPNDWYEVGITEGTYTTVTKVEDRSVLSDYYGNVKVDFASAFRDMTPTLDGTVVPTDAMSSSYQEEGGFTVLYAPIKGNHHTATFGTVKDNTGKDLAVESAGNYVYLRDSMTGVQIPFTITNAGQPDWGVSDVDFQKSHAVLFKDEAEVYRTVLSQSAVQTFTVPATDKDGNPFTTGVYTLKVVVAQKAGGSAVTAVCETKLLLDTAKPSSNTGVFTYEVKPDIAGLDYGDLPDAITVTGNQPLTVVNLGMAESKEVSRVREDGYSLEMSGMRFAKLTFQTAQQSTVLLGQPIGKVEGFRVWNKNCTGGTDLPYSLTEGGESRIYTINRETNLVTSLKDLPAGEDIYLTTGANTICYQVKLENGHESPVYEMTVNVSETAPELGLSYDVTPSRIEGDTTKVLYADTTVSQAFAANGGLKLYHYYKGKDGNLTQWSKEAWNMEETDRLSKISTHSESFTVVDNYTQKNTAYYMYVAVDGFGNVMTAVPQFNVGEVYTFEDEMLELGVGNCYSSSSGTYCIDISAWNMDVTKSTIQMDDLVLPLQNPPLPNKLGYTGCSYSDTLCLYFTKPWSEADRINQALTVNAVGIHADTQTQEYGPYSNFVAVEPAVTVSQDNWNRGTRVDFNGNVRVKGSAEYNSIAFVPIFSDGTYDIAVTDSFGTEHTISVPVTVWGEDPKVELSTIYPTKDAVNVTITSDKYDLTVTGVPDIMTSGPRSFTAVVNERSDLIMKWNDGTADQTRTMFIGNIVDKAKPTANVVWSYQPEDIVEGKITGPVTATLVKKGGSLIDPITGQAPSHTFYPGGETTHTFTGYVDENGVEGDPYKVALQVTLQEKQEPELEDKVAPSVGIVGYVVQNGVSKQKDSILCLRDDAVEFANPGLPDYDAYQVVFDSNTFLTKMGWAEQYRFRVDVADQSNVKLIAKAGLSPAAPGYGAVSDTIDGVTISGRTVDVTKNAAFTLFAVDSKGNTKTIPMNVDNLGEAPLPRLEKIVKRQTVRLYLMKPEGADITDLKITHAEAKQENSGPYNGCYYMEYTDNTTASIHYSYQYKGTEVTGTLTMLITEIDKTPATYEPVKWSANRLSTVTNRPITAQITFNKPLVSVAWKGNLTPAGVTLTAFAQQVTVTYTQNAEALTLLCTAYNGKVTEVALPEITNLDTKPPEVTVTQTLAENAKTMTLTFIAQEAVSFQEGGKHGTQFDKQVSANGSYTYHFSDAAGNTTATVVEVTGIITEPLRLTFSKTGTDAGTADPNTLDLKVGDTLYVKANRACTITFNGGEEKSAEADNWISYTIKADAAGLYPVVRAVDRYKNTAVAQLTQIPPLDTIAPTLSLKQYTLPVALGTTEADLKALLTGNVVAADNETATGEIELKFDYTVPEQAGVTAVTYTATDKAGNRTVKTGALRFYSGQQLQVTVNGQQLYRDMVVVTTTGAQSIVVASGSEPYSVTWKAGIKTVGQMKIGATTLANGKTDSTPISFTPAKSGYYTICVTTQGRDSYRFVLYVK